MNFKGLFFIRNKSCVRTYDMLCIKLPSGRQMKWTKHNWVIHIGAKDFLLI